MCSSFCWVLRNSDLAWRGWARRGRAGLGTAWQGYTTAEKSALRHWRLCLSAGLFGDQTWLGPEWLGTARWGSVRYGPATQNNDLVVHPRCNPLALSGPIRWGIRSSSVGLGMAWLGKARQGLVWLHIPVQRRELQDRILSLVLPQLSGTFQQQQCHGNSGTVTTLLVLLGQRSVRNA